jgi:hypothetical protein
LCILDINKKSNKSQLKKTVFVYLALAALAVVVDMVYDMFGHGVDSDAMTLMYLYPLLGGMLFYSVITLLFSKIIKFSGYRLFFNIYNSGIATLTFGSFLKGVFEIAGTNSPYLIYFYMVGGTFIVVGLILMFIMTINQKRVYS